jgi:hypothetical protein
MEPRKSSEDESSKLESAELEKGLLEVYKAGIPAGSDRSPVLDPGSEPTAKLAALSCPQCYVDLVSNDKDATLNPFGRPR